MITKSRKLKKSFSSFSVLLLIFLFLGIGFLLISNWKIYQKRLELSTKIEALKKEIEFLEKENYKLKTEISESFSESFLEKKAREDLNLKKPCEKVVVILPPTEKENSKVKKEKSFLQKILEKLGF
jgi:cell division protein FtsL